MPLGLFVFSATTGFRHSSIPSAVAAVRALGAERGWRVEAGEDPAWFSPERLAPFDAILFLNTSGALLLSQQQRALQEFVRSGKGFSGVHSASATECDWPWYVALVGARFKTHPEVQTAEVVREDPAHPATRGLPARFAFLDEWYAFEENPRPRVQVLLSLDEATYTPRDGGMAGDHPIAWSQEYDGGRAFYTALGHDDAAYVDPLFLSHLAGGIEWSARVA